MVEILSFNKSGNEVQDGREPMLVRLSTGEVLLGFMTTEHIQDYMNASEKLHSYNIYEPMMVGMAMDQTGRMKVNMMEYIPFSKDRRFTFQRIHVMSVMTPSDEMAQQFRDYVISANARKAGIVTPIKPGIIT
jgi:hypothetical protein